MKNIYCNKLVYNNFSLEEMSMNVLTILFCRPWYFGENVIEIYYFSNCAILKCLFTRRVETLYYLSSSHS